MANVNLACPDCTPSIPVSTSEVTSSIVVSAASQDWLLCCERKNVSTGYEICASSNSAAHRSQSRRTSSKTPWLTPGSSVLPANRTSNSAAAGGDPALASSIEI